MALKLIFPDMVWLPVDESVIKWEVYEAKFLDLLKTGRSLKKKRSSETVATAPTMGPVGNAVSTSSQKRKKIC